MNSNHKPKTRSVWPTLLVKICPKVGKNKHFQANWAWQLVGCFFFDSLNTIHFIWRALLVGCPKIIELVKKTLLVQSPNISLETFMVQCLSLFFYRRLSLVRAHILEFDHSVFVSGGGSVGECSRLSQPSWTEYDIVMLNYLPDHLGKWSLTWHCVVWHSRHTDKCFTCALLCCAK